MELTQEEQDKITETLNKVWDAIAELIKTIWENVVLPFLEWVRRLCERYKKYKRIDPYKDNPHNINRYIDIYNRTKNIRIKKKNYKKIQSLLGGQVIC